MEAKCLSFSVPTVVFSTKVKPLLKSKTSILAFFHVYSTVMFKTIHENDNFKSVIVKISQKSQGFT